MALVLLGEIEFNSQQYTAAAEHFKTAREIRPNDPVTAFAEGQALEKLGDFEKARDALEASLKLAPAQLQARLLLGRVYLDLRNAKAAQDQFQAAQLLDANNLDAQLGLARAKIAARQREVGRGSAQTSCGVGPKCPPSFRCAGRSLQKSRKSEASAASRGSCPALAAKSQALIACHFWATLFASSKISLSTCPRICSA